MVLRAQLSEALMIIMIIMKLFEYGVHSEYLIVNLSFVRSVKSFNLHF